MSIQPVKIILIEGQRTTSSLAPSLQKLWQVETTHLLDDAAQLIEQLAPSLIILDASSRRSNGLRGCRRLHQQFPHLPFIYIAPEGQADPPADFPPTIITLTRPFSPRKLHNRIRALLPANSQAEQIVRFGPLTFYLGKRSVEVAGKGETPLNPKLTKLLEIFLRCPNEIVTRKQLMEEVWQTSYVGDTRTLDVHIRWIREIIEDVPTNPQFLTTVRGMGYILQIPTL